jgi:hypothetical protein
MEHDTMDQPWDPISAVTSALVGDIGSIAMSVADFPREIFKGASKGVKAAGNVASTPSEEGVPTSASKESLARASTESSYTPASTLAPSVTASSSDTSRPSADGDPSSSRPQNTSRSSNHVSNCRLCTTKNCKHDREAVKAFNLETAIGAGRGVQRIVETGLRTPMNFTMGLARGFRNAPKLYNDDTVRREEKVTDFASGLRIAGKEFGLGMFDGISGLVTQPLRGAEKEGAAGLMKGFGKGVGGLVLKGGAAVWSLPAYAMKGIDAEIRNRFSRSSINYIITSRVLEGEEQLLSASAEEQKDIIIRWRASKDELSGFYTLKQKEKKSAEKPAAVADDPYGHQDKEDDAAGPPKTGWMNTRHLSLEERRALHAKKDAWKKRQAEQQQQKTPGGTPVENEEFEQAIRESVQQTSKGDKDEDARVEQAIRASVLEMRRIAEQGRDVKAPVAENAGQAVGEADVERHAALAAVGADQDLTNVSDEEYQALIEEAVKRSLAQQGGLQQGQGHVDDDEELRQAIEHSKRSAETGRGEHHDDEEAVRRAMMESERAHQEQLEKEKAEEQIVLEFIKKQSVAEEELRRQRAKGKGVAGDNGEGEEHDEELKRAMEESLRATRGGGGDGQSSA